MSGVVYRPVCNDEVLGVTETDWTIDIAPTISVSCRNLQMICISSVHGRIPFPSYSILRDCIEALRRINDAHAIDIGDCLD